MFNLNNILSLYTDLKWVSMIHTVRIDDTTSAGKKIPGELHRIRNGVEFDNPAISGILPEGYVPIDEFFDTIEQRITKHYEEKQFNINE
jgi:hypothetical protein